MRRFFVGLFCFTGFVAAIAVTSAVTVQLTLLNRSQTVRAGTLAILEPEMRTDIAKRITTSVLAQMPAAGRTPENASFIRKAADQAVADPEFRTLATQTIGDGYNIIVKGSPGPLVLNPVITTRLVRNALTAVAPQTLVLLPDSAAVRVQLGRASLPRFTNEARWVRITPLLGGIVCVLSYTMALALSRRRTRTVRRIGWWLFSFGTVMTLSVVIGPRWVVPAWLSSYSEYATAINAYQWRTYVAPLTLAGVGLVLALAGVLAAHRSPLNRITRSTDDIPVAKLGQPSVESWQTLV
jgi:hypothetical protein